MINDDHYFHDQFLILLQYPHPTITIPSYPILLQYLARPGILCKLASIAGEEKVGKCDLLANI
jgi:hypothetical protein